MSSSRKDEYIQKISALSDRYCDKLIEFLNRYNLRGLIEASENQLKEFYENEINNTNEEV